MRAHCASGLPGLPSGAHTGEAGTGRASSDREIRAMPDLERVMRL
jgi:hypothetical protein